MDPFGVGWPTEASMGSFDATCAVSNIGITCGDRIVALLIAAPEFTDSGESNWEVISPPLPGSYDDYGNIRLDEDPPEFVMAWLRKHLAKVDAGQNSVHEPHFDPAELDWNLLETTAHQGRLCLKTRDEYTENLVKTFSDPLREAVRAAGFNPDGRFGKDGVHVFPVHEGANLHVIELPFENNVEAAAKLQAALSGEYATMFAAAPGSYNGALIVAPKVSDPDTRGQVLFLGSRKNKRRKVDIVFVREDLLNLLIPETPDIMEAAEELHKAAEVAHRADDGLSLSELVKVFMQAGKNEDNATDLAMLVRRSSAGMDRILHLGGAVRQTATEMVLATPTTGDLTWFIRWVRASKLWLMLRGHQRSGIRPDVIYTGSQCADEDWEDQLAFHIACQKVLEGALAARDAERAEWMREHPDEYDFKTSPFLTRMREGS